MATEKKTVKPVAVATKAEAPKADKVVETAAKKVETPAAAVKAEEKPAAKPAEKKEAAKPAAKKAPAKKAAKPAAKKAAAKPAEKKEAAKPAAKKAPAKKAAKPAAKKTAAKPATAKKAELKKEIQIEFQGKAYTEADLMKIAKDVWQYDLKQKVSDLKSVKLYVKPEENVAYYVMNDKFEGNFGL